MKKLTIMLALVTILLGANNIQLNSIVEAKNENIKIIENENTLLTQKLNKNEYELAKYKNIINSFNDMEIKNIDYVYYDIPLTINEQEYIQDLCYQTDLSYELILAVVELESGYNKELLSPTNDGGLFQINLNYADFYAQLAGLENYDVFNFEDSCRMGIAGLKYYKNYWIEQGITDDETLYFYILNSYNMGTNGYISYVRTTNQLSRSYDRLVSKYKFELEQSYID